MSSFDDVDDQIASAHTVLDGAEASASIPQTVSGINQATSMLPEFTTASVTGTGTGTGGTGTGTGGTGTGTDGSSTGTDDMDAAAIQEANEVEITAVLTLHKFNTCPSSIRLNVACVLFLQQGLALRERAADILANIDVTSDSSVITMVAQTAETLISNPDQMSGQLMVGGRGLLRQKV